MKYPVVDIFAGPGGLGEGFGSLDDGNGIPRFESVISIEREKFSFRTLHLRHFLRTFPHGEFPEEYYLYLKGGITLKELYEKFPDNRLYADRTALQISLGPETREKVRSLITERLKEKTKWVLVGGPPCQAYSLVGRSRMKKNPEFERDVRHFLYREYLKIIVDHAPPIFIMENVKGLLSAKVDGESVISRILADLMSPKEALGNGSGNLGYSLYSLVEGGPAGLEADPRLFLVRAEDFGVPQARHRMFIVGVRSDIKVIPCKLQPDQSPTLEQTIGNLPAIRSGLSKGIDSLAAWRNEISALDPVLIRHELNHHGCVDDLFGRITLDLNNTGKLERQSFRYPAHPGLKHTVFNTIYDPRLNTLDGHEARRHMPSDLRRYAFAASFAAATGRSPKLADFPESLLPHHKNVDLGCAGKMFSDRFRVQLPNRPSTTITSHISKDGHYFIHYDSTQCRSLTVREAARLQTFPDNYRFEGPRTAQYHQVGNAVPPYLSKQIAAIVAEILDKIKDSNP